MEKPRGIRNCNPGNIEFGAFTRSVGATSSDGRFAIFPTMVDGLFALGRLLLAYSTKPDGKGGVIDTVEEAIYRWAPGNENNTEAYIALACAVLQCNRDDRFDFRDPAFQFWMITAIGTEENGAAFNVFVSDAELDEAVRRVLA